MGWKLPGTVLEVERGGPEEVQALFSSTFLTGGLVLSQVARITGLEPYTVQNWVKRGFLPPPERKKYTNRQLCRIIIINMLKNAMTMDRICGLLGYINGQLDDESDDSIDDTRLYVYFLRAEALAEATESGRVEEKRLLELLADYDEPKPGAKERVAQVLDVMLTAWQSVRLQRVAQEKLERMGLG